MPALTGALRLARPDEAGALAELKLVTFRETFIDGFAIPYPPVDLAAFEQASYSPDVVAAELANPARTTWVEEASDGRLIGYAQVGPCKLPHPEVTPDAGELYQIYVRREAQGTGLGGRLLRTALDHLRETRPGPIWLGVWEANHLAQAVYAGRGFREVGSYRFMVGDWEDRDLIYRRD
jgi:ribosomal protein S18 acetylase RimI-like enzyme